MAFQEIRAKTLSNRTSYDCRAFYNLDESLASFLGAKLCRTIELRFFKGAILVLTCN